MKTVKMKLGSGYVNVSIPEENFLGLLIKELPPSGRHASAERNRQTRQYNLHRNFRCNPSLAADERLSASYRERA